MDHLVLETVPFRFTRSSGYYNIIIVEALLGIFDVIVEILEVGEDNIE